LPTSCRELLKNGPKSAPGDCLYEVYAGVPLQRFTLDVIFTVDKNKIGDTVIEKLIDHAANGPDGEHG
jgi:hypothetical protein